MKSKAKNTFVIDVPVHLPYNDERQNVSRWLNLQYIGKELIPLNEKCSQEHKEAAWHIYASHIFRMKFKINKQGRWTFVKVL